MAASLLTTLADTTSSTTSVTSSVAPAAGSGVLVIAEALDATTAIFTAGGTEPTIAGLGAGASGRPDWQLVYYDKVVGFGGRYVAAVFFLPAATYTSGAITITWPAAKDGAAVTVSEITGLGATDRAHVAVMQEFEIGTYTAYVMRQRRTSTAVFLASMSDSNANSTSWTAGFTELADFPSAGTVNLSLAVAVDDSSPPASGTITFSQSGITQVAMLVGVGPAPTAPYALWKSPQFDHSNAYETIGTTSIPTIPTTGWAAVQTGDMVIMDLVSKDNATITPPAGEGWLQEGTKLTQTASLQCARYKKIWGLGGQSDDATPTFTKGAGTNGFFGVAAIIRDPGGGWTSVAAAVLVSSEGTIAAAASMTVPSASYTDPGVPMTFVRFLCTLDDNALNNPSEAGWFYGFVEYDTDTGTDAAMAMSVREGVTGGSSTGTMTFAESRVGNDAGIGRTLVLVPTTGAGNVSRTATDALLGADTATRAAPKVRTATDTLIGSDTAAGTRTKQATAVDALLGTDTATRTAPETRTTSDTLLGGDTATKTAVRQRTASDALLGVDAAVGVRGGARSTTDALLGADTATRQNGFFGNVRTATDALLGADAATAAVARTRAATDALLGSDAATRSAPKVRTATDALLGADAATRSRLAARTATDVLLGGDVATRSAPKIRTTTDALLSADVAAPGGAPIRVGADQLLGTDVATRSAPKVRTATDALLGSDTAQRATARARTATDALLGVDTATRTVRAVRTATDALLGADVAVRAAVRARTTSDALLGSDSAVRAATATRGASDALLGADAATGIAVAVLVATDHLLGGDSATPHRLFARIVVDALLGDDEAIAVRHLLHPITLGGVTVETDAATGGVTVETDAIGGITVETDAGADTGISTSSTGAGTTVTGHRRRSGIAVTSHH